jgi:protein gp37
MNEQRPPGGIEWTRLPKGDGTFTKGYTWNSLAGCLHGCTWTMPDGTVAECYAKTVAERLATSAYPGGFEVSTWHPERLQEPLRVQEPAGIFLDSMSDLLGHWVPATQVQQVLDVCARAGQHTFFLLTKNAPRLARFRFPPNVWVGVSSPPDAMWGHALTRTQQEAMLARSLAVLTRTTARVRWMSFEPLSWDCADLVGRYATGLDWAVIGSASRGQAHYHPDPTHLQRLLTVLDGAGVPVFFKGNLHGLWLAETAWRHDFPSSP